MAEDLIGYDNLVQDALRSVVRAALQQANSVKGLPGKHHFYITFRTHAEGVTIPDHLKARYPDEMTIVLEHQFWDLEIYQDRFRVILKFSGQPHPVVIPFSALTRFFDPSVKFGLQFDPYQQPQEARAATVGDDAPIAAPPIRAREETAPPSSDASIVSLDAFRKK